MCYHLCNNFDSSIRNLVWNLLGFDFPFLRRGSVHFRMVIYIWKYLF